MKKLNLIIGKRQIVIVTLVIILSFAAFLNWKFATGDQAVTVMDISNKTEKKENEEKKSNDSDSSQTYGEAELVNKNQQQKNNYIKQAKIDRESAYDEAIENNNKLLSSQNLNQEERSKVIEQSLQLTERKNQQESIENQIKSKNFVKDCVSYIDNTKVNAIVQANDLNADNITQIKDVIQGVTNCAASNIIITPIR